MIPKYFTMSPNYIFYFHGFNERPHLVQNPCVFNILQNCYEPAALLVMSVWLQLHDAFQAYVNYFNVGQMMSHKYLAAVAGKYNGT